MTKTGLLTCVIVVLIVSMGCGKKKETPAHVTALPTPAIVEPENLTRLRLKAHAMGLHWTVHCDATEPDGSRYSFVGVAAPKGVDWWTVPHWSVWAPTQNQAIDRLYESLSYLPNGYPPVEVQHPTGPEKRKVCPPELAGE